MHLIDRRVAVLGMMVVPALAVVDGCAPSHGQQTTHVDPGCSGAQRPDYNVVVCWPQTAGSKTYSWMNVNGAYIWQPG